MIHSDFFGQFLKVSNLFTILSLVALVLCLIFLSYLKKKKFSFAKRMLVALALGLILGFVIDLIGQHSTIYAAHAQPEIAAWFSLLGTGFLKLVQLLAVPVVFLSIIKVVIDVQGERIKQLTWRSFLVLLSTTAISAVIGILMVHLFGLNHSNFAGKVAQIQSEHMNEIASRSFPEFFLDLVPNNIFLNFSDNGKIVSVVIIAALFASAIRFLKKKKPDEVKPFTVFLESARVVVNSVLTNVIKIMPYGIVALIATTIVQNGIKSIVSMLSFILALYTAVLTMLIIYCVILIFVGVNPLTFYRKSYPTMLFAFSSRSSVGTLPYTLQTLQNQLGVSGETSNFVGTLGTTIGMNGCAGVFPAMLGTIVAGAAGIDLNITFYALIVLVVTIGSIGIAGVPGTATVAATVTLNGLGLGQYISTIGAVFGIDPIIDMGRTMLNVTGSMISAIVVDRWNGSMDMKQFSDPSTIKNNDDEV